MVWGFVLEIWVVDAKTWRWRLATAAEDSTSMIGGGSASDRRERMQEEVTESGG